MRKIVFVVVVFIFLVIVARVDSNKNQEIEYPIIQKKIICVDILEDGSQDTSWAVTTIHRYDTQRAYPFTSGKKRFNCLLSCIAITSQPINLTEHEIWRAVQIAGLAMDSDINDESLEEFTAKVVEVMNMNNYITCSDVKITVLGTYIWRFTY
ncbi:MAG: hypothetical protein ABH884_04620 [Candidatus Komeilibacteria bacterium]